jgi:hypothetical protein
VIPHERCPQCAALVRPDQAWCSLCHANLRPVSVGVTDEAEEADEAAGGADSGRAVDVATGGDVPGFEDAVAAQSAVTGPAGGRHGRHSRAHAVDAGRALPSLDHDSDGRAEAAAGLAGTTTTNAGLSDATGDFGHATVDTELALAGVDVDGMLAMLASEDDAKLRGLVGKLESKSTRVLVVVLATVAVTGVVVGLMFLFGSLLH